MTRKGLSLVVLFVFSLLIGCVQAVPPAAQPEEAEQPPVAEEPSAEEAEKVVTIALNELVTSFDPPADWAIAATWIKMNIYDDLIWRNRETGEFEPWLAESFENINPTTWRLKLREGVKFHNGEDFNADAVVYTYQRILDDPTYICHAEWTWIKEINVLNPYEVEFVTQAPDPAFRSKMASGCGGIVPPGYTEEVGAEGLSVAPVGTGPFKFVEWVKDDHITLEANPDYWQGKPDIDRLIFRSVPETSTRVANLLTGEADLIVGLPQADWERVEANPDTGVEDYLTTRTMLLALRIGPSETMPDWSGPTEDIRIRQAINLAIDRAAIIDLINGMGVPVLSRITPPTLGWDERFYDEVGEYDPERAMELLDEAGYDGEELTFHSSTSWLYQKEVSEALAAMLEAVGLNIDLQVLDVTTFREQVYFPRRNEEIYMDALGNSFFDPWITMREFEPGQKQRSGWQNEEAEQLIIEAGQNMNSEERREQYLVIQETINEHLPHVYLYLMKDAFGKRDRLEFEMGPDGFLWMGFAKVAQ